MPADSIGTAVTATSSEIATPLMTTIANGPKISPCSPGISSTGKNTVTTVIDEAMTAPVICAVPPSRRVLGRHPRAQKAGDVLDDDDRVVDDEPDRQRQAAERHHVQRLAQGVRDEQRPEDGDGQRDGDDQHRAPRVQEQQDDQDGEDGAVDRRVLERRDRVEDELALVEEGGEPHAGVAALDLIDLPAHPARDRDDVCVGLRRDREKHRRRAVQPREHALLLDRVADHREVA